MTPERYARVKELFLQAVAIEETKRHLFLRQACQNDSELLREVEELLKHDDSQPMIRNKEDDKEQNAPPLAISRTKSSLTGKYRAFTILTQHLDARGHFAIGALMASFVLVVIGFLADYSIASFQRTLRAEALSEILDAKVGGLRMWFEHEQEKIASWARSQRLRQLVAELVQMADESNGVADTQRDLPLRRAVRRELDTLEGHEASYTIWDRRHIVIADTYASGNILGKGPTPWGAAMLSLAFEGQTRLMAYDGSQTIAKFDSSHDVHPHMGTLTPIRDDADEIVGALLIHDRDARTQATRIFRMVSLGSSGETYAFNDRGILLTASRFEKQLRQIGLLPSDPGVSSIRSIQLRDPGGDMTKEFRPDQPLSTLPLTHMARHAVAGHDGINLAGYRDYRGVEVVGAWRWLDDYGIGVATEVDKDELEPGLAILIYATWAIVGLVAVCFGAIVYSYLSIRRLRRDMREQRKLGPYTLEQKIGEGGMGSVFKARHDLLKRPTAIKFLKPDILDAASTARFEREAQMASRLTHPNTIDIYDYGVTPEGLFYYVMEHVDGLSLDQLVTRYGPLPPARAVCLLKQICYSLREAHAMGVVHRDLKPQNIMICRRGGEPDVVKVLDFGLVRHIEPTESQQLTAASLVAGTPLYIAPERLSSPQIADPRSDIYSLGAVAFFLLTGRDVFQGGTIPEILAQVIANAVAPPSQFAPTSVPPDLDQLVVDCLAQHLESRPSSCIEMIQRLENIASLESWDVVEAERWWNEKLPADPQS